MVKRLLFFALALLFFSFPAQVFAGGEFATDIEVEYKVEESGKTVVTHRVSVENLFSNLYATSYTLVLDNINPQEISAFEGAVPLSVTQKKEGEKVSLTVNFPTPLVGKGKVRNFAVLFSEPSFAVRTGEVWEISIPRLSPEETFRRYKVVLSVPSAFGNEAYISPKATEQRETDGRIVYLFDKEKVEKTGVTAGFGAFQVFSFTLNYHLENPLAKNALTEIALPPDTALQKVYYQLINPLPEQVYVDADGNWLASYNLKPRERIDVEVKGAVQIFAGPRPFPKPTNETLIENIKATQYWQVANPRIRELAASLQTPKAIYDFVWQTLSYDYDRVRPNIERFGAVKAIDYPQNAICMEFTDLFIAIARAAGIPAREVNGFAYTENPEIQPLSLVADVLHAWPEYWDAQIGAWIPIDPTWASTTGGVDYFSKLDLRHFSFVNHGRDDTKPYPPGSYKLGPNPQKDVFVNFGQLPEERVSQPEILVEVKKLFAFTPSKLEINIKNPGPVALYNLTPGVYFDGVLSSSETIEVLPPFSSFEMTSSIPYSFLGRDTPEEVRVLVLDKQVQVPTNKGSVVIESLAILSLFLIFLVIFVLIKLKKIDVGLLKGRIKVIISKFRKNATKDQTPITKTPEV